MFAPWHVNAKKVTGVLEDMTPAEARAPDDVVVVSAALAHAMCAALGIADDAPSGTLSSAPHYVDGRRVPRWVLTFYLLSVKDRKHGWRAVYARAVVDAAFRDALLVVADLASSRGQKRAVRAFLAAHRPSK